MRGASCAFAHAATSEVVPVPVAAAAAVVPPSVVRVPARALLCEVAGVAGGTWAARVTRRQLPPFTARGRGAVTWGAQGGTGLALGERVIKSLAVKLESADVNAVLDRHGLPHRSVARYHVTLAYNAGTAAGRGERRLHQLVGRRLTQKESDGGTTNTEDEVELFEHATTEFTVRFSGLHISGESERGGPSPDGLGGPPPPRGSPGPQIAALRVERVAAVLIGEAGERECAEQKGSALPLHVTTLATSRLPAAWSGCLLRDAAALDWAAAEEAEEAEAEAAAETGEKKAGGVFNRLGK